MPNYRRNFLEGGTYFFTLTTHHRRRFLVDEPAPRILGDVIRACQARWAFHADAIVLLPDHLHLVITLPHGDDRYPTRLGWIKKEFSKRWIAGGGDQAAQSEGRVNDSRVGVWQSRYWEHTVRSEQDMERIMDYVHYNPVKHGLASRPADWPWSSIHRYVKSGVLPIEWGSTFAPPAHFEPIAGFVGE
jgi:putative transposase